MKREKVTRNGHASKDFIPTDLRVGTEVYVIEADKVKGNIPNAKLTREFENSTLDDFLEAWGFTGGPYTILVVEAAVPKEGEE